MTTVLYSLLWLFIGTCASVLLTFLSVFPIHGLLRLTDAFGRRRGQLAQQRARNVVVALSVLILVMVVCFWLAAVVVGKWLDLPHTVALQLGVLLGGGGMGGMLWIFVSASLGQTIKDP